MNTDRLLQVITLFSLVGILWVLSSVRREWIRVEYSVSWLFAWIVLLILGRWKALDQWLAALVGVDDIALVLLMLTTAVFLIVLYRLSLIVSALKDSNIKLAQRLACVEFQLETLYAEVKKPAAS